MEMLPDQFINSVLGEIIYRIVNGQDAVPAQQKSKLPVPLSKDNFFTWCTPGIPVTPDDFKFLKGFRQTIDPVKFKELSQEEQDAIKGDETYMTIVAAENFSALVDTVPDASGLLNSLQVWQPENRISHIYESVLKYCEVADSLPSPEAEERIRKIRSLFVETIEEEDFLTGAKTTTEMPSKLVIAYGTYMQKYINAYEGYVNLMSEALTGNSAAVMKASQMGPKKFAEVTAALREWETMGKRNQFEKLSADLAQLEGISMSRLRQEYLDMFQKGQRESFIDNSTFNISRLVPAGFYESGGWNSYTFEASELKKKDSSKVKKYSAGGGWGLMVVGEGKSETTTGLSKLNFDDFYLSFELTQVPIVRNWFREDFLLNSKWRFPAADKGDDAVSFSADDLLSSGDPAKPAGKLFAYPTVVLFARNITMKKTHFDKIVETSKKERSVGGGLSLGPLTLFGKAGDKSAEVSTSVSKNGQFITVNGMQIIGFRNHVLPKSPNPDPKVKEWI